jgi:hypothetical protein
MRGNHVYRCWEGHRLRIHLTPTSAYPFRIKICTPSIIINIPAYGMEGRKAGLDIKVPIEIALQPRFPSIHQDSPPRANHTLPRTRE